MMNSAFDKIAAGLEDAIAFAHGDTDRGRMATVDVRAARAATKLSQGAFTETYRVADIDKANGSAALLTIMRTSRLPLRRHKPEDKLPFQGQD
jgi:hypothetical protein